MALLFSPISGSPPALGSVSKCSGASAGATLDIPW